MDLSIGRRSREASRFRMSSRRYLAPLTYTPRSPLPALRRSLRPGDVLAPAVKLVLRQAIFASNFVLQVLVRMGDLNRHRQATVLLVPEAHVDR